LNSSLLRSRHLLPIDFYLMFCAVLSLIVQIMKELFNVLPS
jgi:hypothetical protein